MKAIPLRKFDDRYTITVAITREFRIRVWIAVQLITLAAWVLGGRLELVDRADGS